MKARTVTILATVFVMTLSSQGANGASIVGSSCQTLSSAKWVNGKKYVCTKVNGKKVWKVSLPSPIKTVTSTPDFYEGFGELGKDYKALDALARMQISAVRSASKKSKLSLFAESPKDVVNSYLNDGAAWAVDIFRIYQPDLVDQSVFLYYTYEWSDPKIALECPIIIEQMHMFGKGNAGCGKLFAINMNWGNTIDADALIGTVGHELFHNVQIASVGGEQQFGSIYPKIPSWFREGSAQVAGGLVFATMKNPDSPSYGSRRWDWPNDQINCGKALALWTERDEADGHARTNYCEGGLGTIMVQMLVVQKMSLQPILDVYRDVYAGSEFRDAFRMRFGLSMDQFLVLLRSKLTSLGWKF